MAKVSSAARKFATRTDEAPKKIQWRGARDIEFDFASLNPVLKAIKSREDSHNRYQALLNALISGENLRGYWITDVYGVRLARMSGAVTGEFHVQRDGVTMRCRAIGPSETPWSRLKLLGVLDTFDLEHGVAGPFIVPDGAASPTPAPLASPPAAKGAGVVQARRRWGVVSAFLMAMLAMFLLAHPKAGDREFAQTEQPSAYVLEGHACSAPAGLTLAAFSKSAPTGGGSMRLSRPGC